MKIEIGKKELRLSQIAEMCGGMLVGCDRAVGYLCTDSRETDSRTLFVALCGEKTDGHAYLESVLTAGGAGAICREYSGVLPDGAGVIQVPQPEEALKRLASAYLSQFPIPKVAVTGSVGKTTTKELIACVLSSRFHPYRSEANYNSLIGMPLSALGVGPSHDVAIFEMGMSAPGEIGQMSRVAHPDIAVITNVGSSHLEYLGSREGIARAKWEITEGLRPDGAIIVDGEEPLLFEKVKAAEVSDPSLRGICLAGEGASSAYRLSNIRLFPEEQKTVFCLVTPEGQMTDLTVPALGVHLAHDAAYAAVVGQLLGMREEEIRRGLLSYRTAGLRQQLLTVGPYRILEDCYNASPESVRAALAVLQSLSGESGSRMVAVLGDMRELGADSRRLHRETGADVAAKGISLLMTLGESGQDIAFGALRAGMDAGSILPFRELEDLAPAAEMLMAHLQPGDVILVKASRAVAAERLVAELEKRVCADRVPKRCCGPSAGKEQ